jgi:chaperone required for assembly of F1-ATPase
MKRIYKSVAVQAAEDGFRIALDGKPLRTPARAPLVLPGRALAEAIAAEWDAQAERVIPDSMPLMQLVSTAIDRVAPQRALIAADSLGYAGTDLICYRAEAPADLAERQRQVWQPLVDWARLELDAPLAVATGIMPRPQPAEAVAALRAAVETLDPLRLAALHAATAACGSLVIGLALLRARLSPDEAFAASQLDETYQIEKWGEDIEAAKRREALRRDIAAAARLMELLRS